MKIVWVLGFILLFSACTTEYVLVDGKKNTNSENAQYSSGEEVSGITRNEVRIDVMSANDVYPLEEGENYVVYQYQRVKVNEVSALATLYCDDVMVDGVPYLRDVIKAKNGFMQATFDCINLAN